VLGKLTGDPNEFAEAITQSGFQEIAITARHEAKTYDLPPYHRDPFDRLLIAQAK
jgi:PIN domain nuclease of toxin-antitoxin system